MRVQPRTDTNCELLIRSALHRRGLRFRVNSRPEAQFRRRADVIFRKAKVAVFIDGCFWHGCARHASMPVVNRAWWCTKINRNRLRDRDTNAFLRRHGWYVIRVWEHADAEAAADRIAIVVAKRIG